MSAEQFLEQRPRLVRPAHRSRPFGRATRILEAVSATRRGGGHQHQSRHLLLCAPLAARRREAGADPRRSRRRARRDGHGRRRCRVPRRSCSPSPAASARPRSMTCASAPNVPLLEAMRAAAGRDSIARQYVTGFDDVFDIGVAALGAGQGESGMWPTVHAYLAFLDDVSRQPCRAQAWPRSRRAGARPRPPPCARRSTATADEAVRIGVLLDFDGS